MPVVLASGYNAAMTVTLIHNPRCSKSRQALTLLEERAVSVEVREYLKVPLSLEELTALFTALDRSPRETIRFKENVAKELGIDRSDARDDEAWIALIAEHPILLERPIVWKGDQARVGRPPEAVLELI